MKKLFLAFSLIGLLGCGDEEKVKVPKELLPPAKLTSILADIHVAESQVELMHVSPDTASVVFKRLQNDIFKKHKVSQAEFSKTYDYYINHISEMDKIYEGLVDTLGMREIKISSTGSKADTTRPMSRKERILKSRHKLLTPENTP